MASLNELHNNKVILSILDDVWRNGDIAPPFLTSALGGEGSTSSPGHFATGEIAPGTPFIGGWVGHTGGLNIQPRLLGRPVATSTELPQLQNPAE
jgi:hypothetical protein